MIPAMMACNLRRPPKLLLQLCVVVVVKIIVLLGIWHLLLKDHKVQGHAEAVADYFLKPGAKPQVQVVPRSPWE